MKFLTLTTVIAACLIGSNVASTLKRDTIPDSELQALVAYYRNGSGLLGSRAIGDSCKVTGTKYVSTDAFNRHLII